MIRNALSTVAVFVLVLTVNASAALAADEPAAPDPTGIGDNIKDIVLPNAKAFWIVCLIGGVLGMAFSRRASRAGGIAVMLIISGIAIYNPSGVGSMMKGFADQVLTITPLVR
jgi:hypothetical protein